MLKVLRLLLEIRQQQREILQRLSWLEQARQEPRARSPSPVSSLPPQCPQLPAFTIEDFEAAEAALRDDRVAAALSFHRKQLLRLGGNNLKEVAANVMSAVMGVAVQRLFSLRGRKGKRPFVGTKLCRRQGVDILAAQGFIGRWLPGACDRGGGLKRRYAQAFEPPESHAPSEEPQTPSGSAPPVNPCAGSVTCPGAPSASCPATPPGMAITSPAVAHPSSAPSPAPPQPPPHAQPPHAAPLPHG
ncbi:uncharacterized protein LOC144101566 [Amblyomma americanum]